MCIACIVAWALKTTQASESDWLLNVRPVWKVRLLVTCRKGAAVWHNSVLVSAFLIYKGNQIKMIASYRHVGMRWHEHIMGLGILTFPQSLLSSCGLYFLHVNVLFFPCLCWARSRMISRTVFSLCCFCVSKVSKTESYSLLRNCAKFDAGVAAS